MNGNFKLSLFAKDLFNCEDHVQNSLRIEAGPPPSAYDIHLWCEGEDAVSDHIELGGSQHSYSSVGSTRQPQSLVPTWGREPRGERGWREGESREREAEGGREGES